MEIDLNTKIAALLDAYPALEQTLIELSPSFAKLQNPVLRRTVARVTTIQQAARIAGIPAAAMVMALRRAAGLSGDEPDKATDNELNSGAGDDDSTHAPVWFDPDRITVRYDATPVIESGQSPLQKIVSLAEKLGQGDILELTAPFKPVPIIDLLKSKGFGAWSADGKSYFVRE